VQHRDHLPADARRLDDALHSVLRDYAEFDTPEEVDALFRAQRRLSVSHALLFLAGTLTLPVVQALWPAWTTSPVWGGLTPAFIAATVLYPLFCIVLAASYTMRANRLDEDLLGRTLWREDAWEPPVWTPPGAKGA
jgi:uncharacterized membrane protein (DUF485 family)